MERKKPTCGAEAAQRLYRAINRREDEVVVRQSDLNEIIACHRRWGGKGQHGLPVGEGSGEVSRARLFAFIQDHGEICGKPNVPDDWVSQRAQRADRIAARRLRLETAEMHKRNEKDRKAGRNPGGGMKRKKLT